MRSPFPGMDPYLEHPALWPDVHNSLIAALRDALAPLVAPRYYVGLERRTYLLMPDDLVLVGRPDLAVVERAQREVVVASTPGRAAAVVEVEVPVAEEVGEDFLEIHEVETGKVATIIELLSPVNKLLGAGREAYQGKRAQVLRTRTNLVEIDLLRAGEPMPVVGPAVRSDYTILVSPGLRRPRAQIYAWSVRQPIPTFSVPLLPGDAEPTADVGAVLAGLYDRARYDLRVDYAKAPVPPLAGEDAAWARALVTARAPAGA
jgi:hypothetical protein